MPALLDPKIFSPPKLKKEPDLRPALLMRRFKRLHPGAQKGEAVVSKIAVQNCLAGKTSLPILNGQRNFLQMD
jgi:hypothetical protein